ncbi:MAG TPA: glycosyltransferase family 39 protein [Patescibacteria group bacterium]|nr:glycosyltransferase family 39 protein [Patescibacteria group bacterium]
MGVSDSSVIAVSTIFFIGSIVLIYLLGKRLFRERVGILSAVAGCFNVSLLSYATSGASESLFIFEILLAAYLILLRKRWANLIGILVLVLMYFTKAQSIIFIFGLLLFFFLLNYSLKSAIKYFVVVSILGILVFFAKSYQGIFAITQTLPGISSSVSLRGVVQDVNFLAIVKKLLYNLYNFYKLLPQTASPYMWALFFIGILIWGRGRAENSFKVTTIIIVALTFAASAITIPLYRYIHPVVPLVYLLATATLVWIIGKAIDSSLPVADGKARALLIKHKSGIITFASSFLILFFVVGQTLGVLFLDSRFISKSLNKDKTPVYVQLSRVLKENTKPDDVVLTNLDTWGSWYGERKTIWYPLKTEMLKDVGERVDAIYITDYLIDDENYYMGQEWRQILENPRHIQDKYISENYKLAGEFSVSSSETYEQQGSRAVLLVRK